MINQRKTLQINSKGKLVIGGVLATKLAKKYGTPLYVFDEQYILDMANTFTQALEQEYGGGEVLYASKAFSCLAIYKLLLNRTSLGVDVVSEGELYTALTAGFKASKIYFHGNNKLECELEYAIKSGVGTIVADALSEIDLIDTIAKKYNIVQNIMLRVNPGVEAHTHHFIQTARVDSKFGFALSNGQAELAITHALSKGNIKLKGLHSHIGSQIFEKEPFRIAAQTLIEFYAKIKKEYGFEFESLNMGGGFGIWYYLGDKKMQLSDYRDFIVEICSAIKFCASAHNLKLPHLIIEPGRSLIGEAGITLYTVGAIKDIPNVKKYVSVDGGMFDNPRYALYQAKYTAVLADNANKKPTQTVTISGKCCESGDIICADVSLPQVNTGDVIAIMSTGAYNYSMASNYNRNKVPAAVIVSGGKAHCIIKRQTNKDLIRNDVLPQYLK